MTGNVIAAGVRRYPEGALIALRCVELLGFEAIDLGQDPFLFTHRHVENASVAGYQRDLPVLSFRAERLCKKLDLLSVVPVVEHFPEMHGIDIDEHELVGHHRFKRPVQRTALFVREYCNEAFDAFALVVESLVRRIDFSIDRTDLPFS